MPIPGTHNILFSDASSRALAMSTFSVILAAAGKSSRYQDQHYKKPFAPLNNKAVWLYSAERFLNRDDVKQLILVIASEDREAFQMKFGANVAILGVDAASLLRELIRKQ